MKMHKLLTITTLALIAMLITTGAAFAIGAVNQDQRSSATGNFATFDANVPPEGEEVPFTSSVQEANGLPVVSVFEAAGGSTTPPQKEDAKKGDTITNGDFVIVTTEDIPLDPLGDGRNENTIWTFDFAATDPNWSRFRDGVDERGLRSALLTLSLIPMDEFISTDTLKVGDLHAIGATKEAGGQSPFVFPPFQKLPLFTPSIVEIELLSFYTPEEVLGAVRGAAPPAGQMPVRFQDDAIVVFAHLKLTP
jgi:hypothetical protein